MANSLGIENDRAFVVDVSTTCVGQFLRNEPTFSAANFPIIDPYRPFPMLLPDVFRRTDDKASEGFPCLVAQLMRVPRFRVNPKPETSKGHSHAFFTELKDLWQRRSEAWRPKNASALFEAKVLRNRRRSPRVTKGFYNDRQGNFFL